MQHEDTATQEVPNFRFIHSLAMTIALRGPASEMTSAHEWITNN